MNINKILKVSKTFKTKLSVKMAQSSGPVWRVSVMSEDGEHELADGLSSYEEAKSLADEWLGQYAEWEGPNRAVSEYGSVLHIEKRPASLSESAENVWDAVNAAWSADALELWWSANTPDPTSPGDVIEPYLGLVLEGMTQQDIDKSLDELLEKGFIKRKFTSKTWDERRGRYKDRPEGGAAPYELESSGKFKNSLFNKSAQSAEDESAFSEYREPTDEEKKYYLEKAKEIYDFLWG